MDIGEFRELTKGMPDDVELIIVAKHNPCGNCWTVLSLEATSVSSFGIESPALKLAESDPEWVQDDESDLALFVNPRSGQWVNDGEE